MTRPLDPAHLHPAAGLFRPADHVLVVPTGSALTILDLDRGIMYATTPFGAAAWGTLVGGRRPPRRAVAEARRGYGSIKSQDAWTGVAGYLIDRGIIEPVLREAES